jgi:hypothetical protein
VRLRGLLAGNEPATSAVLAGLRAAAEMPAEVLEIEKDEVNP